MRRLPILLALVLSACSGSQNHPGNSDPVRGNATSDSSFTNDTRGLPKNVDVEKFDVNGDHHPDIFKFYAKHQKKEKIRRPIRVDMDLNFDRRIDIRRFYDSKGKLTREEMDLDFDGRVDNVSHYQDGKMVLQERSLRFDGKLDTKKFFQDGVHVRTERDSNHDGRVDTWIYYAPGGKITRIGRDKDGDGKIDFWESMTGKE